MASADLRLRTSPSGDSRTGSRHAAVEVHTVDTDGGVVLDTQVDVFRDAETKVAGLAEVLAAEFVFLDLEASLEDLLGLGSSDRDVHGDLFVTTDTEGSDGVASLACWKRKKTCVSEKTEPLEKTTTPWVCDGVCVCERERKQDRAYCRQEFDQTVVPTPLLHG